MNKKHIVLFDMDGTLTEPRKLFDRTLLEPLRELSKYTEIGIVTGSDYDYVKEQMDLLIRFSEVRFKTHLLPCNGTKHYLPPEFSDDTYKLFHENNMREYLGSACFRQIVMILSGRQEEACYSPIPLTGHFINYRGSMINWSPIGRNANEEQRKKFQQYDNCVEPTFRQRELDKIKHKINLRCQTNDIVVKLGGETSFDIYPKGWDKTYALKHFTDYECWFVGDRCDGDGNDKEIYELLLEKERAYKTTGPAQTYSIIENIIGRMLSNGE